MTVNRTIAPELQLPGSIEIKQAEMRILNNGLRIYVIDSGDTDVMKMELVFPSGSEDGITLSRSIACHQLADSGTDRFNALEIAEKFDFYGSFFQAEAGPDFKSFNVYSLPHYVDDTLEILLEILKNACYPEAETKLWKQRNLQALQINKEKVSWLAKTTFNQQLFGADHPYGSTPDEQMYNEINPVDLGTFYKNSYRMEDAIVIVSGKISAKIIESINHKFGSSDMGAPAGKENMELILPEKGEKKTRIHKNEAVQSGIRIGKVLFSKSHPDFLPMLVVNTILGGYFGSRLMSNIREDKGYTYGIGSGIHSFKNSGMFFIATEVGKDVCSNAIEEIYKELNRLAEEPVGISELNLVKNYLLGSFQRSLDSPFALADRFKGIKLHNLNYDYFNNYLQILNKITPFQIQELAVKHLRSDSMTEVIAG